MLVIGQSIDQHFRPHGDGGVEVQETEGRPTVVDEYRDVLGRFAAGVVIVTGMSSAGPVGLTIQSFTALSLAPPLILLSIDRRSISWPAIAAAKRFAVNVIAHDQR